MTRRHDTPTDTDQEDRTMTTTTSKIPRLAVYGTLREGHALARWLDDLDFVVDGHVRGALHFVHGTSGYPVYLPDGDGDVRVEVYQATNRTALRALARVLDMETGAGYDVEAVEVQVLDRPETITALACVWHHDDHGDRVPGDDWTNARGGVLDGWVG